MTTTNNERDLLTQIAQHFTGESQANYLRELVREYMEQPDLPAGFHQGRGIWEPLKAALMEYDNSIVDADLPLENLCQCLADEVYRKAMRDISYMLGLPTYFYGGSNRYELLYQARLEHESGPYEAEPERVLGDQTRERVLAALLRIFHRRVPGSKISLTPNPQMRELGA